MSPLKKIIFNADDFGMCEGVNYGIIRSHQDGVLSSTTLLVNAESTTQAVELAKQNPTLKVGLHLTCTIGKPVTEGDFNYVDDRGYFKNNNEHIHCDPDALYNEWKAQIEKFINLMGYKPTHLDSHHHQHLKPWHIAVVQRLAKEYGLYYRHKNDLVQEGFPIQAYVTPIDYTISGMDAVLDQDEVIEIMTHPAFVDQYLLDHSSWNTCRCKEMEFLRSDDLKLWLKQHHIEVISFDEL